MRRITVLWLIAVLVMACGPSTSSSYLAKFKIHSTQYDWKIEGTACIYGDTQSHSERVANYLNLPGGFKGNYTRIAPCFDVDRDPPWRKIEVRESVE